MYLLVGVLTLMLEDNLYLRTTSDIHITVLEVIGEWLLKIAYKLIVVGGM